MPTYTLHKFVVFLSCKSEARTFKLSEDINLNLGNKNINLMKGYSKTPDLESKVKNVKFQEIQANFFNPLEGSRVTCF